MTDETKTWTIDRTDDRRLRFRGILLGEGERGSGGEFRKDWTRGVRVRIYRTAAGKYVVARTYWSRWQGESDHSEATACETPEDLLAALRDQDGAMRCAEREAWDEATDADDALAAIECEEVE